MTLYVPERKVWTQQPANIGGINWNNPLNNNLIFCAPLTNIDRDIVGGRIITKGSGASLNTDYRGESLKASGSAAVASVPINLSPYTAITVSFWMWWDAFANDDKFAMEYTNNANSKNGFWVDPNASSGKFDATATGTSAFYQISGITRPSAAAWHHYTVSINRDTGTSRGVSIYVDGVEQSATGTPQDIANNFDNSTLYIFSRGNSSLYGAGRMQNLCIRYGIKDVAEIARAEYENPWQIFAPRRQWFAMGSTGNTLRVPFKTAAGADDNIWLTTDNTLRFNTAAGYYDPIAALSV